MNFNWLAKDKTLTDENVYDRLKKVKTAEDFFDFVGRAKELNTEKAGNAIGWLFDNAGFIGKDKYTPVYMGVDEFAAEPELFGKMFEAGVDALKTVPEGAKQLRKMLENEDRYYDRLYEKASRRGAFIPELKTHEDDVIAALLERGKGGDTLAFHELGFYVGNNYPEKVRDALAKTDDNHVVLSLFSVANAQYVKKVGIDSHKKAVLEGLLTVLGKIEEEKFVNVKDEHVKDIIDSVCNAMLDTETVLADLRGERRGSLLNDSDESVDMVRCMFAYVDKRLGHEDCKYATLFDYIVDTHDRTIEAEEDLKDMHKVAFPEQEPA